MPATTSFIFKTWPFYCCGNVALSGQSYMPRRFSEKRGAVMADMYRRTMSAVFPAALWWDTRALSEPRPLPSAGGAADGCHSNHLDSYLVEQDVATFRHLICHLADTAAA